MTAWFIQSPRKTIWKNESKHDNESLHTRMELHMVLYHLDAAVARVDWLKLAVSLISGNICGEVSIRPLFSFLQGSPTACSHILTVIHLLSSS